MQVFKFSYLWLPPKKLSYITNKNVKIKLKELKYIHSTPWRETLQQVFL